jgi:hypothetical protein
LTGNPNGSQCCASNKEALFERELSRGIFLYVASCDKITASVPQAAGAAIDVPSISI